MSDYPKLTYSQLTDLLNYVVGLPYRDKMRRVTREKISSCVVQTWTAKHVRSHLEHVCEVRLIQLGVLPETRQKKTGSRPVGRPLGRLLPERVRYIIEKNGGML